MTEILDTASGETERRRAQLHKQYRHDHKMSACYTYV